MVAFAFAASIMVGCGSGGTTTAASSSATSSVASPTPTAPATGGQVPTTCPSTSVVSAALGQSVDAPTLVQEPFGISCTYPGSGPVPTKIDFQQDTAASFDAGEKAVPTATIVTGLGDAAYVSSGFLAVLHGSYSIRVLSPFSSAPQLEALARKLL